MFGNKDNTIVRSGRNKSQSGYPTNKQACLSAISVRTDSVHDYTKHRLIKSTYFEPLQMSLY